MRWRKDFAHAGVWLPTFCYFSPISIERLRTYLNKFIERKGIIECTLQRVIRSQKDFAGVVELKADDCTDSELI